MKSAANLITLKKHSKLNFRLNAHKYSIKS